MKRLIKMLLLASLLAGLSPAAHAFSLLGQFKNWQITPWGYRLPGDIGGPMTLSEGFRWNVPVIYYSFDPSFVAYFGSNGMAAVDQAMKIFNDLPKFSEITNDDSSLYIGGEVVPTDSRGPQNFGLNVAGVRDLKSQAMGLVIEELGLAEPTRWTWALRGRNVETIGGVTFTNYTVTKYNYDPITYQTTFARVNGALYSYIIEDPIPNINYADAIEQAIDVTNPYGPAVADQLIFPGEYYFGLTQDDVGGLRFLYHKNNLAVEQLLTTVTGGVAFRGNGSPWAAYVGLTNITLGTNLVFNTGTNIVITGLRPGVNKLKFQRINYDSLLGQTFRPITNFYNDLVISNSRPFVQPVQRMVTQPDILFTAEDLGLVQTLVPVLTQRSGTGGWQNNDAINGNDGAAGDAFGGPGVIAGPVVISFSDQLPYISNTSPDFLTGDDSFANSSVWGSFDENSETPIIYPAYLNLTLQDIQRLIRQRTP
ncbi:MAG: hypothetical protein QOF48_732 [Verrucomicrobiota bacterium]|jgi:hypothetical protein